MRRVLLLACSLALLVPASANAQEEVVAFVVRHAERADDGGSDDPPLSAAGLERAVLLARVLTDAGVKHVHSTDLRRTRETGALVAARQGLALEIYDPRDLPGLAERIRHAPGRHLVLGHSNTVGETVAALGGDPGAPIADGEYDRLYVVTIAPNGSVSTLLLRFGAPFEPWAHQPAGMRVP